MASTSRQSSLFGAQDWQKLYQAYSSADLQSYDYESLRKNFIDYLTANYPETFNDYVESSEFVALLDVMAYMGQALAFRGDLNARENFLDTAQRRDSVIKLANLISYNPKRNNAAQGLVKVTALSTTENITDINGNNLGGRTISWNDPSNATWQEQFNTIINATLLNNQRIGKPGNSQDLLGIKTDEYTINIPASQLPIVTYQSQVGGTTMNFELTSVSSLNQSYLYELPPAPNSQFNILYRNDKLGYGSINTGFFFYFKQGSLQTVDFSFTEAIQNNMQLIKVQGVNNDDTWLYKLDTAGTPTELWTQVQNVYTSATDSNGAVVKSLYSVTSRANDEVTYVFGDGVFSTVPTGSYRAYVRSSNALQYTINPAEMSGVNVDINYISRSGRQETLTVTFSLQTPNSTAQNRESLSAIKERAPARFYTQNRMVNGEDYTSFPFTLYNSIIKSKALNRSSIGVSRNLDLLDPTGKYSSTNVFADDGALTFDNSPYTTTFSTSSTYYATEFLSSTLPNLLAKSGTLHYYHTYYKKFPETQESLATRWWLTSINGTQVTGYFYTQGTDTGDKAPIAVGSFSSTSAKYITKGALIQFVPVNSNQYFDENNRLTSVNTGKQSIWVAVEGVVGDGYNYGIGNLSSGLGPITLSGYVPKNVKITDIKGIVPEFSTTLSTAISSASLAKIRLKQNFALQFSNGKIATDERWSIIDIPAYTETPAYNDYIVKFEYNATDSIYTVSIRTVSYSFSSVSDVRFTYDSSQRVYDPKTGQVLSDYVNVLVASATNGTTNNYLNVIGQPVQSDGYSDDFQVTVSPINQTTGYSSNPNFFSELTGSAQSPIISVSAAVFFSVATGQADGLTTTQLLSNGTVVYSNSLTSLAQVSDSVYEYETGQVFYCPDALSVNLTAEISVGTNYYLVTATCNIEHKLTSGKKVTIKGAGETDTTRPYNGTFVITKIDEKTFTYRTETTVQLDTPITNHAIVANRFYSSSEIPATYPIVLELSDVTDDYKAAVGKGGLNFQYRHNSGQTSRIDPATSNIIDLYLVTQSYYTNYMNWISDTTGTLSEPDKPTLSELQQSYGDLESYKMVSDSVVLNSVTFKPLFGSKAAPALRATIKVVKNTKSTASETQIRSSVLSAMNTYFSIDNWNFGDKFYFSELSAYLHSELGSMISSVILVSSDPTAKFGDMYEVRSAPHEIFVNGATISDIVVLSSLTASNMNR
jgi:hypothetical protein